MRAESARAAFYNAKVVLFDFDGVLVDSNRIKTAVFFELAESVDRKFVPAVRDFLIQNSSATRFMVVDQILELAGTDDNRLRQRLLKNYSQKTKTKIKCLQLEESIHALRKADRRDWGLISATEQNDLVELCHHHNLQDYFAAGLLGSPSTKVENIRVAAAKAGVQLCEAIYLGDRLGDLKAAIAAGTEFIFVKQWSDANGPDTNELEQRLTVDRVGDLIW